MTQFLIALDQLVNTLIGGWADETLSARAWRAEKDSTRWKWTRRMIDFLFFDQLHCQKSYEAERDRAQLPPELR